MGGWTDPGRPDGAARPASGLVWVGAYELTAATLGPVSLGLAVGTEIVLATAVCSFVLATIVGRHTGEPRWRLVARWLVTGTFGVLTGIAVAVALRLLDPTPLGLFEHLDVGTTIGFGAAAGAAGLPSLMRIHRRTHPRIGADR